MAALRAAFRSTPRAHILRPSPAARLAPSAQRRTAAQITVPTPAPAPGSEAEQRQEAERALEDLMDDSDPRMNGNYPNPPAIKRQHRDPHADWWDPIERRNYGEVLHEDNDILGIFSTEDYTHFSAARGGFLWLCTIGLFGLLGAACYRFYPGRPSAPRTFPGGLEEELGGPRAVRARKTEEEQSEL